MSNSAFTPSNNLSVPATTTQAGTVSTVAQTFAGKKTFDGGAAIKGDTSGSAIASGYVGYRFSLTNQAVSANTTGWTASASMGTLPAGVWMVVSFVVVSGAASLTRAGGFISTNNNADNTGNIAPTVTEMLAGATSYTYFLSVGYLSTTGTALYAKGNTLGASTTMTFSGYAIRIA